MVWSSHTTVVLPFVFVTKVVSSVYGTLPQDGSEQLLTSPTTTFYTLQRICHSAFIVTTNSSGTARTPVSKHPFMKQIPVLASPLKQFWFRTHLGTTKQKAMTRQNSGGGTISIQETVKINQL